MILLTNATLETDIVQRLLEMVVDPEGGFRPAWVIGVEIKGLSESIDLENVHENFLERSVEVNKVHYYLDGHNWSDTYRAVAEAKIELLVLLLARKRGA